MQQRPPRQRLSSNALLVTCPNSRLLGQVASRSSLKTGLVLVATLCCHWRIPDALLSCHRYGEILPPVQSLSWRNRRKMLPVFEVKKEIPGK